MKRESNGRYAITSYDGEQVPAFVPVALPPTPPVNLLPLLQDLEQASAALGRLDSESRMLPDPDLFVYSYVRREAQFSSQIEGTQSSLSDLFEFEFSGRGEERHIDAAEVSNYVAALEHGLSRVNDGFPLSNRLLREMHALLLRSGRGSGMLPGEFRRSQNWIGGARPGTAVYVPPPPDEVEPCMAALERFIHNDHDGLPALVRAGLAHAQFESIHPFLDGNGRIGRLLISFILQSAGLMAKPLLYLSLYFKQHRSRYYDLLSQLRTDGDWEAWTRFFVAGVRETAEDGARNAQRLSMLFTNDRQRIEAQAGRRAGSMLRAHEVLTRRPVVSIGFVREQTGVSWPTAGKAIERLVEMGLAHEMTGRRSDRLFAYTKYLDILSEGTEPL